MVKRLPAMWETWVGELGWEDPLEKEMAAHSSTLAWKIPWMEEPGGLRDGGTLGVLLTVSCTHAHNMYVVSRSVMSDSL